MIEAFSEKDLDDIFNFIDGKLFPHFGKGIHTWPNGDENAKRKFAAQAVKTVRSRRGWERRRMAGNARIPIFAVQAS